MANLSKTVHTNFYQNRSTFAEVMHKSILVFLCPTVHLVNNWTDSNTTNKSSDERSKYRDAFFPDGERPATDTKHDISEERWSLQRDDRTFVDSVAEHWLWSCTQIKQTTPLTTQSHTYGTVYTTIK